MKVVADVDQQVDRASRFPSPSRRSRNKADDPNYQQQPSQPPDMIIKSEPPARFPWLRRFKFPRPFSLKRKGCRNRRRISSRRRAERLKRSAEPKKGGYPTDANNNGRRTETQHQHKNTRKSNFCQSGSFAGASLQREEKLTEHPLKSVKRRHDVKRHDSNKPAKYKDDECTENSFSPRKLLVSFIHLFKQSSLTSSAKGHSTLIESSSQASCLIKPPKLSFCHEQMTCAHLDTKSKPPSRPDSTSLPPPVSATPVPIDPVRLCSIAFFDLDDTLIPTDWIRRAFLAARNDQGRARFGGSRLGTSATSSSVSVASDLKFPNFTLGAGLGHGGGPLSSGTVTIDDALSPPIQNAVRRYLEELGGPDFDERAASIIEKACLAFGVVVVVTNARSVAWLKIVSDLFPKMKAQLRRFSVPLIRAAVPTSGTSSLRTEFTSVGEYFQYWTRLKKLQFDRVAVAAREVLSQLKQKPSAQTAPKTNSSLFRSLLHRQTPTSSEDAKLYVFREPDDNVERSISTPITGPSQLAQLPGGELLLSPRSHGKESYELEDLLRKHEVYMSSIDDKLLMRIVMHQVRRFLLHHHSVSHPDIIADLPYSPRNLLSGTLPSFPATPSHSRYTGLVPLRLEGFPAHDVPHLPEVLSKEYASRQTARFSPAAVSTRRSLDHKDLLFDIVCVGDSEFELCAARELALTNPEIFRGVGLIKCRPGLPPDAFRDQLDEIEAAMACISIDRQDPEIVRSGVKHLGPYVACEFTTRACGFRPEMFGLSLAEREALRFKSQPIVSEVPVKGISPTPSHSLSHIARTLHSQRTALTPRASTQPRRTDTRHGSYRRASSYDEWPQI